MSLRLTPEEIRSVIKGEGGADPWEDLVADFDFTGNRMEDAALMIQCTKFLDSLFPNENWGWQDFDKLISTRLVGRWPNARDVGKVLAKNDVKNGKLTREMFTRYRDEDFTQYAKTPGRHAFVADDEAGGVIVFVGVWYISDVRR